jgi:hypothetical protein
MQIAAVRSPSGRTSTYKEHEAPDEEEEAEQEEEELPSFVPIDGTDNSFLILD